MPDMGMQALVACDEDALTERFATEMGEIGLHVQRAAQTGRALAMLSRERFDAVLVDCDVEGGMDLIELVRHETLNQRALVFAVVSGNVAAREANKFGAHFVFNKPLNWDMAKKAMRAARTMIIREGRSSIREKVRTKATIVAERLKFEGIITDLSESGLALQCAQHMETGKQLQIEFSLPGSTKLVQCTGKVTRCKRGVLGIQFLYLSAACAEVIMQWLRRHSPGRKSAE